MLADRATSSALTSERSIIPVIHHERVAATGVVESRLISTAGHQFLELRDVGVGDLAAQGTRNLPVVC